MAAKINELDILFFIVLLESPFRSEMDRKR